MSLVEKEADSSWEDDLETAELACEMVKIQSAIENHGWAFTRFWDFAKEAVDAKLRDCSLISGYELDDFLPRRHPGAILPYQTIDQRLAQIEIDAKQWYCDSITDEDIEGEHKFEQQRDDAMMEDVA